jgi:hypothetical protein
MNRTIIAALVGLLVGSGGCTPRPKAPASANAPEPEVAAAADATPGRGKPSAPVAISAELSPGRALVTVRFDAPAADARVHFSGVDGLLVTSAATPMERALVERGTVASFDVTFTPGPGRSHLVVAVAGRFPNGDRASVASFAVGAPSGEQRKSSGLVVEGADGERIRVLVVPER